MMCFLKKAKHIATVSVMTLVLVFSSAYMVKGAVKGIGSRKHDSYGYKSHTSVTGYDDNTGVGYNVKAYAKIGTKYRSASGVGSASVDTEYIQTPLTAMHDYGYGSYRHGYWGEN